MSLLNFVNKEVIAIDNETLLKFLESCPDIHIFDSFIVTNNKLKSYKNIACAVSGGSDSDIMLDICAKLDTTKKIRYVWFNTGLEYQATKNHLTYLEDKYGIKIEIIKAVKPIPIACKQYGQPFLSKKISDYIERLQNHGFKWEDKSFEALLKEYPKCKAALRWWCNEWGENSRFNISRNKWLKEFMIANPPDFKISPKCCDYAKKKPIKNFLSENKTGLNLYGVRKSEGGVRSTAYKNCFTLNDNGVDEYRPIFWYLNETKQKYEKVYDIKHSNCYSEYGLTRTGCAGCPFGKDFEKELEIIEKYEPKLYKAVNKIFGDSYRYTRAFREYQRKRSSEL